MTGIQLKNEIKKLGITQEVAASQLGVTRATLNNWCKQEFISPQILQNINAVLGIEISESQNPNLMDIIKSQQRTIEMQAETIKNLTSK